MGCASSRFLKVPIANTTNRKFTLTKCLALLLVFWVIYFIIEFMETHVYGYTEIVHDTNKIVPDVLKSVSSIVKIDYELKILSYAKLNKKAKRKGWEMYCRAVYTNMDPILDLNIQYWGEENNPADDGYIMFHIMKITHMYKALQSIYNNISNDNPLKIDKTVILFADAFDVFYQFPKKQILDRFLSLNNHKNVIYMSENNIWPPMVRDWYPKNETIYINAGVWIGFIKPCLDLYTKMNNWIENDPKATRIADTGKEVWLGDQDIISWEYINQTYNGIGQHIMILDRHEYLFQSMNDKSIIKWNGTRWYNTRNKGFPLLVHYNGDKRPIPNDVQTFLKLNNRQKINGNRTVHIQNGFVKYREICEPFTQYYY
eukprot:66274_1